MPKLRKRKDILKEKEAMEAEYKIVANSFYKLCSNPYPYFITDMSVFTQEQQKSQNLEINWKNIIDKRKLLQQEINTLIEELKTEDDDE